MSLKILKRWRGDSWCQIRHSLLPGPYEAQPRIYNYTRFIRYTIGFMPSNTVSQTYGTAEEAKGAMDYALKKLGYYLLCA